MQRIDELLDKAIQRLKNGESVSSIVSNAPENLQDELKSMLEIVALFSSLPVKQAPVPAKRRLYLQVEPQTSMWFKFGLFLRRWHVAPAALAILFLSVAATAFGAYQALPGDTLFSLKKTVQTARVNLETDPQARAQLQLALADQRIQEAQQVINSTDDASKKQAALQEVKQQTTDALNDLKQVASVTPSTVAKAESLAKAQQTIVAKVDPGAAQQTKQDSKVALRAIQNLLATTNDENGTILPPAVIDVTGVVSAVKDDTITVDKNIYTIDELTTEIKDKNGKDITFADLAVDDTVKIEGKVQDNKNMADTITVLDKMQITIPDSSATQPQPDSKAQTANQTSAKAEIKTKVIKVELKPSEPSPSDFPAPIDPKPQDTHAGFIVEPPADLSN